MTGYKWVKFMGFKKVKHGIGGMVFYSWDSDLMVMNSGDFSDFTDLTMMENSDFSAAKR